MGDQIETPPSFRVPHDLDEAEREIKMRLSDLHREYAERCKPYVQMLARIEMMRPARPVWIDMRTPVWIDMRTLDELQHENIVKTWGKDHG